MLLLDGELTCLQPLMDGRVCCRFDRVSAFMVARQPHRPEADGLTATLGRVRRARGRRRQPCAPPRGANDAPASRSCSTARMARCA
jgi:hypothetical protein